MASKAEILLRDMYDAFYRHVGGDPETMESRAIEATGEYLHDKVTSDGLFPEELTTERGKKHDMGDDVN